MSHQNLKNYEEETQLYIPDTQAIMDVMHDGPGLESPSGKFPLALQAKNAQNVKALDKPLVEVPMVSEQVSPLKRVTRLHCSWLCPASPLNFPIVALRVGMDSRPCFSLQTLLRIHGQPDGDRFKLPTGGHARRSACCHSRAQAQIRRRRRIM